MPHYGAVFPSVILANLKIEYLIMFTLWTKPVDYNREYYTLYYIITFQATPKRKRMALIFDCRRYGGEDKLISWFKYKECMIPAVNRNVMGRKEN